MSGVGDVFHHSRSYISGLGYDCYEHEDDGWNWYGNESEEGDEPAEGKENGECSYNAEDCS